MAKLIFAVHGRGSKGNNLSITDTVELPSSVTEKTDLSPEKGQIKNIFNQTMSIEEKLKQMDKIAEEQKAVKKITGGGSLSVQDHVRAIGVEYLLKNYSDKISLSDVAGKFLIKENEIELYNNPDGDFVFELATIFG